MQVSWDHTFISYYLERGLKTSCCCAKIQLQMNIKIRNSFQKRSHNFGIVMHDWVAQRFNSLLLTSLNLHGKCWVLKFQTQLLSTIDLPSIIFEMNFLVMGCVKGSTILSKINNQAICSRATVSTGNTSQSWGPAYSCQTDIQAQKSPQDIVRDL